MNEPVRLDEALVVLGLSHHKAGVSLRERLAFRAADQPRALGGLLAHGCREAVILSTCNRVEVIAILRDTTDAGIARVRQFISEFHGVPESEFGPALYEIKGINAARHLFEVAASLDSQILGETEILSQSKEAYRIATEAGSSGPFLSRLFERSFFLSKELRTDGGISRSQASVSSAAVSLARKVFEIKGSKVLLVGTGEMATGIIRGLRSAGAGEVFVASRTEQRAMEFAAREGAKHCHMLQLDEHLQKVDIVLVSSAAPHYVIEPTHIKKAAAHRHGRALCLIDISVPRNVDPGVSKFEDVYLFDIDALDEVARDGRREREAVAERWRPKLAEEAREILRELQDRRVHDAKRKLIEHFDRQRKEVFDQVRKSGMDERAVNELVRALERLQGKFLYGPLEALQQAVREGDGEEAMTWVWRLFRLELAVDSTQNNKKSSSDIQENSAPEANVIPSKEPMPLREQAIIKENRTELPRVTG